ncbi:MAG TPA: hypothetical protein VGY13_03060 [Solirubrobacteraceae bacterium]|jgi:hypothetical protein|nr:hypothetical protein [Solirubrobacteraceae bacterium]
MGLVIVAVLLVALAALVVVVVGGPLRRARAAERATLAGSEDEAGALAVAARERAAAFEQARSRDELEAAREAKYREIRDTELDYRTGKLSHEDYEAIDADLRAEAIEILDELERLEAREPPPAEQAARAEQAEDEDALRPRGA